MGLLPGSDSNLARLTIKAHTKIDCADEATADHTFVAQSNPEKISYTFKIDKGGEGGETQTSTTESATGNSAAPPVFKGYTEMTLEFEIKADATGIVPIPKGMEGMFGEDDAPSIRKYLEQLQNTVYAFQEESHGPPYLSLEWGTIFPEVKNGTSQTAIYKGMLSEYTVVIELFSITGEPIKATITLKIDSLIDPAAKPLGKSPDLTHHIPITFGDKMTMHCNKIYGRYDAQICTAVAEYNNMIDWNLQNMAGKTLAFPSIHLLNEKYLDVFKGQEPKQVKLFNKKSEYEQMVSLVGEKKAKQYFKTFGTA